MQDKTAKLHLFYLYIYLFIYLFIYLNWALTKDFSNICDWFVDNKRHTHFKEDKTKSILFSSRCSRCNLKLVEDLDIRYKDKNQVIYASAIDEIMLGETMALRVIEK